jgi:hypothetical protein
MTHYSMPMTSEQEAALAAMPKLEGAVVNLFFVPPRLRPGLEDQWREWCRAHPRSLWPEWLVAWGEYRKSGQAPGYVGRFEERAEGGTSAAAR